MKFILSLIVVTIVIFIVSATPDAIDNAPDWVLLIPVAIGAFLLAKHLLKPSI